MIGGLVSIGGSFMVKVKVAVEGLIVLPEPDTGAFEMNPVL